MKVTKLIVLLYVILIWASCTKPEAEPLIGCTNCNAINFDDDGGDISVRYQKMEGDFDSRIDYLSKNADGRWLLCAQHLHSWANLWAPKYSEHLPSLSLLLTRLVTVEVQLE